MPEVRHEKLIHISSAVVRCLPAAVDLVRDRIAMLQAAEVVHSEGNKFVVIIEGASSGAVGACLARISAFDGVVSAALVYEQVEPAESVGEQP